MIIKKFWDIPELKPREDDIKDVLRRVLIGPDDGSENIILRHFKVLPGGHTPLHAHSFEHVVKVEKGKGIIISPDGKENPLSEGMSLLVASNEKHQFQNPYNKPFEFLCIILNPDKFYSET